MKSNVAVTGYKWAADDNDITILDFTVFKRSIFGGMKPDKSFNGWCLSYDQKWCLKGP